MKRIEKTRVVAYNVFIAKDGKEFESEQACIDYEKFLDGTRKICPNCNGQKQFYRGTEKIFNEMFGPGENPYQDVDKYEKCEVCNGKGYLEKKVTWE
jgi:hypothetical protein